MAVNRCLVGDMVSRVNVHAANHAVEAGGQGRAGDLDRQRFADANGPLAGT